MEVTARMFLQSSANFILFVIQNFKNMPLPRDSKLITKNLERIFIKIFTSLVIFLLIIFLWNEINYFDLSTKINDSKVNNFFASVGALLTGLSILYVSLQMVENKKNREAIFLPDIIPKDTSYVSVDGFLPLRNLDPNGKALQDIPFLELYNAGSGVAKKISANWKYDEKSVADYLKSNNVPESDYKIPYLDRGDISYISSNQIGRVEPSRCYFQLYRPSLNRSWDDIAFDVNSIERKPALFLSLNYLDVFDKLHFRKYSVKITATDDRVELKFSYRQDM